MTDKRKKRNKLSLELLGLFAVCLLLTLLVYGFLTVLGAGLVARYGASLDPPIGEERLYQLDQIVFTVSLMASVGFFVVLFSVLFGERIAYIRTIIRGVETIRGGDYGHRIPAEGNNELTELAETVNYLSETQKVLREKERRLQEDREELIRSLSHDIRTPLTSILSYSELIARKNAPTPAEYEEYVALISRKAEQIRHLTDILLEGGRRSVETFEDAGLLFRQLAGEFEELLEDHFRLSVDLSRCPSFCGRFDVGELRRIFDNLISNVQKYADPAKEVTLTVCHGMEGLVIHQSNSVIPEAPVKESYRMGLNSIRRIAQSYAGRVEVEQGEDTFAITVTLSEIYG